MKGPLPIYMHAKLDELAILQQCQSAVLNIHAIAQPIRYAFLQHLILYTFLQQQTHYCNILYTFLKIINQLDTPVQMQFHIHTF